MIYKLRKIWNSKGKIYLSALLVGSFIVAQVPIITAYEAHVINVTAKIVQPCDEYYISGYKFLDSNQNGVKDEGEQGLSGWIIELQKIFDSRFDYNDDGLLDDADLLILNDVADDIIECPEDKKCHLNNDGWVDEYDVMLLYNFIHSLPIDLGNTLTDANGYYEFMNLEPGVYIVNEVMQDGWTPTTATEFQIELSLSSCESDVNFGNFREGGDCDALSIGYWQNHGGCPVSSEHTDGINALSSGSLMGAFSIITGPEICTLLAPKNCPGGGTLEGKLCRAKGKALADETNIVSGHLDINAVIAGADDGSSAFDNLGLDGNSTVQQALIAIESVILNPAHTKAQLTDAAHVGERIYAFYEYENLQWPACLYYWEEPVAEPEVILLMSAVYGCTDVEALNYNAEATEADGSCEYEEVAMSVPGCTDVEAKNFNAEATEDDGSCKYKKNKDVILGCMDIEALNFNAEATEDDGLCQYPPEPEPEAILGCMDQSALNFDTEATQDDGSCQYEPEAILGCMDSEALNYNVVATQDDGTCEYPILGCTDTEATNYNAEATQDDDSCEYPVPEPDPILGCMDTEATNYNAEATQDDVSCEYTILGCTDIEALNFSEQAGQDDGSCQYPEPEPEEE